MPNNNTNKSGKSSPSMEDKRQGQQEVSKAERGANDFNRAQQPVADKSRDTQGAKHVQDDDRGNRQNQKRSA
jgi:hypothetical protein